MPKKIVAVLKSIKDKKNISVNSFGFVSRSAPPEKAAKLQVKEKKIVKKAVKKPAVKPKAK